MEIVKGLVICFGLVLLLFGISNPQTKVMRCDSCETVLTKQDSLKMSKEVKHSIDSFVAVKKKEISRVGDTIKKIERKIQ